MLRQIFFFGVFSVSHSVISFLVSFFFLSFKCELFHSTTFHLAHSKNREKKLVFGFDKSCRRCSLLSAEMKTLLRTKCISDDLQHHPHSSPISHIVTSPFLSHEMQRIQTNQTNEQSCMFYGMPHTFRAQCWHFDAVLFVHFFSHSFFLMLFDSDRNFFVYFIFYANAYDQRLHSYFSSFPFFAISHSFLSTLNIYHVFVWQLKSLFIRNFVNLLFYLSSNFNFFFCILFRFAFFVFSVHPISYFFPPTNMLNQIKLCTHEKILN